jgi:ACS family tartrate transporter-like MFS transporter
MEDPLERVTMAKVTRRIIPFLFVLYIFNYLDRLNVAAAALTMRTDLKMSDEVYGFGFGIFFIGYVLFEVPSNLMLERFGARRWIARIMISWGIISASMMFVHGTTSFYTLRILLGIAEAGFFPGIVVYMTHWFPASIRARAAARFMVAATVSGIIGGPLAASIMGLDGIIGLKGWQWLFLLEGIPSIFLGFAALRYMTDRPADADWLEPEERTWLIDRLARETEYRKQRENPTVLQALRHPKVMHLCSIFILTQLCGYALGAWSPQVLQARSGWTKEQVLWIGALPGIVGAIAMLISAAHSDRTRDRRLHLAFGILINASGVLLASLVRSPIVTLVAFAIMALGGGIANAPFWAVSTSFLTGAAAAGGIATINSVGNLGGLIGPTIMGYLKQHTHGYESCLAILSGTLAVASLLAFMIRHDVALEHGSDAVESG